MLVGVELDTDGAVEAVLDEFGGDYREAIEELLHDVDLLARDFNASVSRGFVRHQKRRELPSPGVGPR